MTALLIGPKLLINGVTFCSDPCLMSAAAKRKCDDLPQLTDIVVNFGSEEISLTNFSKENQSRF